MADGCNCAAGTTETGVVVSAVEGAGAGGPGVDGTGPQAEAWDHCEARIEPDNEPETEPAAGSAAAPERRCRPPDLVDRVGRVAAAGSCRACRPEGCRGGAK
ncbi:hypothetical protein [Saccharomonospora sp. CUA-673]|uniref:hypothetical protein n=1 Tax=Saccharomonospora sp. CUA-673 TaxID=1904969 RepID=UPI00111540CD|nr:hypothetical protein [Saccharomonospora sp. CUA-673]